MRHRLVFAAGVMALGLGWAAGSPAEARVWNFNKITPTQGPWGTKVRLMGYNFSKDAKVYYDGQLIEPLRVGNRVIVARIPENSRSGWFEIKIGDRQLRAPVRFEVKNKPVVTDLQPRSGPPGIWVTVKGKHLPRNMRFWIGRKRVRKQYVSRTAYKLLIHKGLRGGRLGYAHGGRRHRTRLRFKVANFPVIKMFSPKKGYFGDRVTLQGLSFCPKAKVYLDGTRVKVLRRRGDRRLVVKLPKGVSTGQFEVECFGKRVTHGTDFVVEPPYAEVTGISPSAGKAGRWITVQGMGLTRKDRFWLGNRRLRTKFRSNRQVRVYVPKGARSAPLYYESFGKRFKAGFRYTVYRPPVITGFAPRAAWYGSYVTIRGRNFCPMIKVRLGGRTLPVVRRKGSREVTVQIPKGARAGKLSVQCLKWRKTYPRELRLEAPKAGVRKVTPTFAPPGSRVEIHGFNLRPSDRFYLGERRLPTAFESSKRVSVTLPQKPMKGTLVHQTFGRKISTRFEIRVGWPKPKLRGFEPKKAWYNEVVTLEGSQICDAPVVRLGRQSAPVVDSTAKSIKVTVPRGSKGGVFRVRCHNHKVRVPGRLRIEAPYARVVSIYPKRGPWGTWVTLTGKNFRKRDRFWIGRKPISEVRRISDVEVRIKVPKGAKTGPIVVRTRGRRKVTEHKFTLAFPVPRITRVKPGKGWWGDVITIRGKDFCPKPVVRFGRRVAFDVERKSETRLKVRIPKQARSGRLEVRCYGKAGRWGKTFRIRKPKPRVVDMYPDRGPPKRWVTISGHNLDRLQKAWLHHRKYGRVELVLKPVSKTRVKALVPAGCKGGVLIIQAHGKKNTTSFTYTVPRKYR